MADNYVKDIQFLENSNEPDNRWILHCLDKLNYFVSRQEHRKNEYIR